MATQKTQTNIEINEAAKLVLQQEEERKRKAQLRSRRKKRKREKEQLAAVQRMQQSIETMKFCMVAITAIMFTGIVIAAWVLIALNSKLHQVQAELQKSRPQVEEVVDQVEKIVGQVGQAVSEVEKVRESLRHPMQSLGNTFGAEIDAKLNRLIGDRRENDE